MSPAAPVCPPAPPPAPAVPGPATHPGVPPVAERGRHPWAPVSVCRPSCLPPPGSSPRVGPARRAARLAGFLALLLAAVPLAAAFPVLGPGARTRIVRGLFRVLLAVLGVRVVHTGAARFTVPGAPGVLVVANHLSWLDILVLGSVQPLRMVAKREIRDWPLIGAIAALAGTLFVDRAGLRSLPAVVDRAAEALRGGAVIGLFPEGTTWCGAARGPFHRAGFQAALDAGAAVRPVTQRMRLPDGTPTGAGSFIGEDTMLDSLRRVVALPALVVEIEVLPPLVTEPGLDRRELARRAARTIDAALVPARTPALTPALAAVAAPAAPSPVPSLSPSLLAAAPEPAPVPAAVVTGLEPTAA